MSRPLRLRWILLPLALITALAAADLRAQPPSSGPPSSRPPLPDGPPAGFETLDKTEQDPWLELFPLISTEPEEALDLIELQLENPDLPIADRTRLLATRASILDRLGRSDEAAEARGELRNQVRRRRGPDRRGMRPGGFSGEDASLLSRFFLSSSPDQWVPTQPSSVLATAGGVFLLMLAASYRQSRVGRGSRGRWIGVSLVFTALGLLPLWTLLVAGRFVFERSGSASMGLTFWAIGLSIFFLMAMNLRALNQLKNRSFNEITTGPIPERVAELSRQMGVHPPLVRMIPADTGDLSAMAFMSSIAAPTLLTTGGILHRLTPEERDAILAHELGHIANLSLWWFAGIVPVAASAAVFVAVWLDFPGSPVTELAGAALFFGGALATGLKRVLSRVLEYDCDRRAAEAVGHQPLASALSKIHVLLGIPNKGLLSWMIYATATHPSRDERIDAIARQAPEFEPVTVPWERGDVPRRRWAARCMTLVWLTVLAASLVLIRSGHPSEGAIANLLLLATVLIPPGLVWWVIYTNGRWMRRRMAVRGSWWSGGRVTVLSMVLMIAVLIAIGLDSAVRESAGGRREPMSIVLALSFLATFLGVLAGMFLSMLARFTARDETRIVTLLLAGDYEAPLALAERKPRRKWSPTARYNLAICHALNGDRERGREEFRKLADEGRGPLAALLVLAMLQLEDELPREVLATARDYEAAQPRDPAGPLMEGVALLELGELDGAWEAAERSTSLKPDEAQTMALKGRIAMARGDVETAVRCLDAAEGMAPGDISMERGRFELAMREGNVEGARVHLDRIRDQVMAAPLSFMQARVKRLERRWEEKA